MPTLSKWQGFRGRSHHAAVGAAGCFCFWFYKHYLAIYAFSGHAAYAGTYSDNLAVCGNGFGELAVFRSSVRRRSAITLGRVNGDFFLSQRSGCQGSQHT